ncbi:16S rRNA processing protein RimM [Thermotomaculum hydrothermale]|uniref:Ribosome maturation factor RimM n=1 Tax=Thermotomaculum hydrothermale TaxID=981385 RepID=A0A7R6SXL8_9BACT|nr:ribosome maturation factor RimM [Thermotomaculum hydrothermale]BBB31934.1 16S rRNA processing protein RimM [Thermotomaculum hydrothermale]
MKVEYLTIGKIAKPQGNKGEVIVNIETDFPSRFFESEFLLVKTEEEILKLKVLNARNHKGRVVLKFEGYNSINDAETLRDAEIIIPESEKMEEEDFYYFYQLEGMEVETIDGEKLGSVKSVLVIDGNHDVLEVKNKNGQDILIPFVKDICVEVDTDSNLIKVNMPEGLKEANFFKGKDKKKKGRKRIFRKPSKN